MVFIDSHCHLHDSRIISDILGIEDRAENANVKYMVTCATMESNFELTAQLSEESGSVLPCFGIHPWFVENVSENWKGQLEKYVTDYPSGIGETGLDFTNKSWDREKQVKVFEHHMTVAREFRRPINIHIRKAWDTFIHILKKFGKFDVPGIIHSYSGSADMIPVFEKFGLYLSFSGSITNPENKRAAAALEKVSKDRFVLETDTPDIYPYLENPGPSRLNEPENLPAIAQIAARRIGMELETFSNHAYHNSLEVFGEIVMEKNNS